jgi:hypothetical protein
MKRIIKITALIFTLSAIPAQLNAREFLNTVLHLNFGGMYSFANVGDFIDEENDKIDEEKPDATEESYYETAYTFTLDIVPFDPILLGLESNAVKFGIRVSYGFNFVQQRITSGSSVYNDQLMNYDLWMIGPVIHFAPVIDPSDINNEYMANSGFIFFATWGRLNGNLDAYAALRDAGISFPDYDAKIKGYKFNVGFGAEIALCSLNFGFNLYYSYTSYKLNREIYPDAGKDHYMREGCLELYIGLPIESFIKPFLPVF